VGYWVGLDEGGSRGGGGEEEEGKEGGSGIDFGKVSANDDGYCRL